MTRSALDEILEATREEVVRLREQLAADRTRRETSGEVAPRDVVALLRRAADQPLRLIAEIKHRSPSAGALSTALSVSARAQAYEGAGAAMISVLVDRTHFDGGYDQLQVARATVSVPILCKGFIIDDAQVEAAARAGADAVLLIARILDDGPLKRLSRAVRSRGMTPIVEVIDECELDRALSAQATIIGVNARDLATLQMDADRASRVLDAIPPDRVALFFSGLAAKADVARIAAVGRKVESEGKIRMIDGALVGEALMRLDDPAPMLAAMVAVST